MNFKEDIKVMTRFRLVDVDKKCKQRLKELFPKDIPDEIQERYEKEKHYLENSEYIDEFEIYRSISEVANKAFSVVNVRPTVSGSILCYLLGNSYNPLPPYYYCCECGYYERTEGTFYGADAPRRQCPNCRKILDADGNNIPLESVWGIDGEKPVSIEYEVELNFVSTIKYVLESLYPDCIVAYWTDGVSADSMNGNEKRIIDGYVVLSKGFEANKYPEFRVQKINGETHIQGNWSVIEKYMIKYIRIFVNVNHDENEDYVKENGLYFCQDNKFPDFFWNATYNTTPKFRDKLSSLFREFKPETFTEIVAVCSSVYNSYTWDRQDNQAFDLEKLKWFLSSDEFRNCPCLTREDFYEYLCKLGMKRTEAFKVAELVRKGAAVMQLERLLAHEISKEVLDVAKNYRYIVSRAYAVQTVYQYWIKRKQ